MDRKTKCLNFIEGLKKADHMENYDRDENGKRIVIKSDIPEGIKERAIEFVNEFSSKKDYKYYLYSGQTELEDISYYLREENDSIVLVCEIDIGMKHHNYFYGPESFLYGTYCLTVFEQQQAENKSR